MYGAREPLGTMPTLPIAASVRVGAWLLHCFTIGMGKYGCFSTGCQGMPSERNLEQDTGSLNHSLCNLNCAVDSGFALCRGWCSRSRLALLLLQMHCASLLGKSCSGTVHRLLQSCKGAIERSNASIIQMHTVLAAPLPTCITRVGKANKWQI